MSHNFRQTDILRIAKENGRVTVEALADRFGVTLQTIRRDLAELTHSGSLDRVHGGAILPSGVTNIEYEDRRNLNASSKGKIAKICASYIPDKTSVFLGIGTTPEAVARELNNRKDLLVVTNNMHVAEIMKTNESCDLVLTGGAFRNADSGLVGPCAVKTLEMFKFDFAVIGCSALDQSGDMLDFDMQEVVVNQALLRFSREMLLVVDNSKFQRSAPYRVGSLRDVGRIFTDNPLPEKVANLCKDHGVEVLREAQNS